MAMKTIQINDLAVGSFLISSPNKGIYTSKIKEVYAGKKILARVLLRQSYD